MDKIIKLCSKRICQRRMLTDAPYTRIVYSTHQYTPLLLQLGILEVLNYNHFTFFCPSPSKYKGLKTLSNTAQCISHLLQLKLRRLPFPRAYIILTASKRRFVRERLKSLNSIAIKLIVKVVYVAVRIFIWVSIRRQRKAKRGVG